jgi:hypothetical protein
MSRSSQPPRRAKSARHFDGVDDIRNAGVTALASAAKALGPQTVITAVICAGFYYAVANGANVWGCGLFGSFALILFFSWCWWKETRENSSVKVGAKPLNSRSAGGA